jgi:hypothetical protein
MRNGAPGVGGSIAMSEQSLEETIRSLMREVQLLRADLQRQAQRPVILSKKRAATELSISLSKLKTLIRTGEISVCEVGRTTMVPASEVARLAEARKSRTAPVPSRSRPATARKASPAAARSEADKIRAALRKPR